MDVGILVSALCSVSRVNVSFVDDKDNSSAPATLHDTDSHEVGELTGVILAVLYIM